MRPAWSHKLQSSTRAPLKDTADPLCCCSCGFRAPGRLVRRSYTCMGRMCPLGMQRGLHQPHASSQCSHADALRAQPAKPAVSAGHGAEQCRQHCVHGALCLCGAGTPLSQMTLHEQVGRLRCCVPKRPCWSARTAVILVYSSILSASRSNTCHLQQQSRREAKP